ncbi:hypothetical protein SNOG_04564 [Parastagonospora nodorum SN15]|uniref:Uncharacterized protein n=1 Tax=Phaeosphaeria nodorum (strain SN15 / ATCC MYA-4574 / FGSC 10173) TaxID=321614 RepID=Q0UUK0_PHANO|nr:hypothetical protein SNOG_04564 [Parastagonospora nodorum SN15]EAT88324.2 hypothetical protein SNOG_04564 [Parastagonospora nodorum SN15]
MAPTLRSSTQRKTASSAKAANDAGSTRKPRAPLTCKQRYTRTKGLVSWKKSKKLDAMYVSHALGDSPLLCLPAEIRNMIFQSTPETATLIYSENCFAFQNETAMNKWLDKRLIAQREAIRWMLLRYRVYERQIFDGNDWTFKRERQNIAGRARTICPNLVEMEEDDWLDECLCASPAIYLLDDRSRGEDPSSGEDFMYVSDSDW